MKVDIYWFIYLFVGLQSILLRWLNYRVTHIGWLNYRVSHIGWLNYRVTHIGWLNYRVTHIGWLNYRVSHLGWLNYRVSHIGWLNYRVTHLGWLNYRVTHIGWDCKYNLKLLKYDDYMVKLSLLPWILYFNGLFTDMTTRETSLQLQIILTVGK